MYKVLICLMMVFPFIVCENKVVDQALKYRGVRYRYGGLTSRGIDCSGLVVRAMLADGKKVPHKASYLWMMGESISYRNLQAGDLVFFGRGRISHVGIYIEYGKFVHASNSGVKVNYLWEKYYAKRLKGARRVLDNEIQ